MIYRLLERIPANDEHDCPHKTIRVSRNRNEVVTAYFDMKRRYPQYKYKVTTS